MQVSVNYSSELATITLGGRLDAHGAKEIDTTLTQVLETEPLGIILDLAEVTYISSAGLRVIARCHTALHARGGKLILSAVQPYNQEVLRLSGFEQMLATATDRAEAEVHFALFVADREILLGWQTFEKRSFPAVDLRLLPLDPEPRGMIRVIGSLSQVCSASLTANDITREMTRADEPSIAIGGLGEQVNDFYPLLGELTCIGGAVVWLPSDGNNTPDFLMPSNKSSSFATQIGYQMTLAGGVNEAIVFTSVATDGVSLAELYEALFEIASSRTELYRGALGVTICGQVAEAWACGVKKAPILANRPSDGGLITDPENVSDWFEVPTESIQRGVTGVLCAVLLDGTAQRVNLDETALRAAFAQEEKDTGFGRRQTHTHGLFFEMQPLSERMVNIEREIQKVVETGELVDMRHLDGKTRLTRGLVGLSYVQQFE